MAMAFASKSVAVSAISMIVRKSFDYLEKYAKAEGMKSVQERLERTLPQVQVVFDAIDMERIRDQSEALDAWLWQLRDAIEEAEDALDEVEYYKLEKKVKTRGNKVSSSLYKCKRVVVQQFNSTFKAGTFKRLLDAIRKLDEVVVGVERFVRLVDRLDSCTSRHICHQEVSNPRETSSFSVDEIVIGRDTERDQIVEWLVEQDNVQDHDVCSVNALSIVGIGGMGKTTLAQAVYNDQRVKQCFDQAMWICVSNDFDVPALTKKIIQEITREGTNVTNFNTLQEIVRENLKSKKFLLVFDDVWNDERRPDWEKLVAPLKFGQKGSKILLTTRMESVVDIVERVLGGRTKSLRLEGLHEKDLLAIFNRHAFFEVNPNDYFNLQEIGKKITRKLSGCPLAAKIMGGLLNNSLDSIYWNRMLRENISNIEHNSEGIMKILRLSYHHLAPHLQACFRYCGMFREDYWFRKDELINFWMGSGLIQLSANENQRPEDIGEFYLGILTKKSFFELRLKKSTNLYEGYGECTNEYYVMHDLLHELARTVSRKECMRISSDEYGSIPRTVRHAAISIVNHVVITDFSSLKNLRTLLISFDKTIHERDQWIVLKKMLKSATKLRVVHIQNSSLFKLPDKFGNLMHLRYLYHSESQKKVGKYSFWCPCSIYKLYHLQMIQLNRCLLVSWRLGNLISLRHIYFSGTIYGFSPYIGHLTSLQDLHDVNVPPKCGFIASELMDLKDLRYLCIRCLENVNADEATLAKLGEKENLIMLSLTWKNSQQESDTEERVLNNLQPHMNLTKLKIKGYNGSRSPCWLGNTTIINLTYLYISNCSYWQHLPPLGELPSLKYLYLICLNSVKRIDSSFYGCERPFGFPSLEYLFIEHLPALEEWVEMEGEHLFPRLKALVVRHCKELRNVPALPSTVTYLEMNSVGLTTLHEPYVPSETAETQKPSLSRLKICHCPYLETLEQLNQFLSLEELHIEHCENLLQLPMDHLQMLPFLKHMTVLGCPKLMVPPATIRLPLPMKKLHVGSCGTYETWLVNSLCGLTSLTTLMLYGCDIAALPPVEVCKSLIALSCLEIVSCHELADLNGMEELTSLTELKVIGCNKLEKLPVVSSQQFQASEHNQVVTACTSYLRKLKRLQISDPFVLQWAPLRSVTSVTNMTINSCRCLPEEWLMQNCNHLQRFGVTDASHLEFLPSIMASLTSLESLQFSRAMLIQSLPELPSSLWRLQILGCNPVLMRRCRKSRGRDWHKIAHIPDLRIVEDVPLAYSWYSYM
uniref:Uncharacterized protein n=1 Tax=Oryza nivara TaxID=4536 RepID=A0A0E0IJA0_ORYNI